MSMTKQVLDLQKATFDGMMDSMLMFWDQTERTLNTFMEQAVWVPEEGKRAFNGWIRTNKKGCEDFMNAVADGFNKMESCFAEARKPEQPETQI